MDLDDCSTSGIDRGQSFWSNTEGLLELSLTNDSREVRFRGVEPTTVSVHLNGGPYSRQRNPPQPERWRLYLPDSTRELEILPEAGSQAALDVDAKFAKLKCSVRGEVGSFCKVNLAATSLWRLEVRFADCELRPLRPGTTLRMEEIALEEGSLTLANSQVSRLRLMGKSGLKVVRGTIGELAIRIGSKAQIISPKKQVTRLIAFGAPNEGDATFLLYDGTSLRVGEGDGLDIAVASDSEIIFGRKVAATTIRGPGHVDIRRAGEEVTLGGATLSLGRNASLLGASGRVILRAARDATLAGKVQPPSQLEILDLANEPPADVVGSSLSGIRLPVTTQGLRVISALRADAQHVSPLLGEYLPGSRQHARAHPRRKTTEAQRLFDAVYARALSDLANQKGADGATRTLLAHCRYRTRNRYASSTFERLILSAYRLIGYGERMAPALLTFLAVCVFMTLLAHAHDKLTLTPAGARVWVLSLASWLVTPLHVLRLTPGAAPSASFSQPWDTIARLLIAIPFATAALALRKFVKEERAGSNGSNA